MRIPFTTGTKVSIPTGLSMPTSMAHKSNNDYRTEIQELEAEECLGVAGGPQVKNEPRVI